MRRGRHKSGEHLFELLDGRGDVLEEAGMVAEEVGATAGEEAVEGRAHLVGIGGDGPLDVVLLPGQTGVDIDVALLVEEAVGGLYRIFGDHGFKTLTSSQDDIECHHEDEADSETDGAEVGVLALGGFGDEFLDNDVEHGCCRGGGGA